jgi:thioredoxin 1
MSLLKIDADVNKELIKQKGISDIPYLELYKDGKLVWKHDGFIDEDQLLKETVM